MKDFMRALTNPMGVLGALLLVCLLTACGPYLDRRDEIAEAKRTEQQQAKDAKAARRERAAQSMCASDFGPNVLAVWVDQFSVECVNKHGRRLAFYAMEAVRGK